MVRPAKRDGVLVADPATESPRLREPQVMRVRGPSAADQARLGRNEPEVRTIAVAARFAVSEGAFVYVPCHGVVDPPGGAGSATKPFQVCGQG
jgi:hypothetical protein